jgi:hypothetical protein
MKKLYARLSKGWVFTLFSLALIAALSACATNPSNYASTTSITGTASLSDALNTNTSNSFSFAMVPSPGIKACLRYAAGYVTITPNSLNDDMKVRVSGLAPNTGYDLFVIQLPNKPFGISWYQSDLETDAHGNGSAEVRGIFDVETFSVSPGGTTQFAPTHQYHLGLWFNDPQVPFKLGCEPGKSQPIVTPFNGEQHAGIQVLNTANFALNAGPLSKVHR